MRKILMRAAMSPLDNLAPFQVIRKNAIGNNIGNLLFPHSIFRTLMTEDTQIDTINFSKMPKGHWQLKETIQRIDEEYDILVLPFANAFRVSFMGELNQITKIVKGVHIPCVVVGAGMQAALDQDVDNPELDDTVQSFVKAVLDKSACLGLRGEYTANYLKRLGFQEERDYTVIGCPSMFLYGKELPAPAEKELTPKSRVSINSKVTLPQEFHDFLHRCWQELPDHYYIPQVLEEIYLMYVGMPFTKKFAHDPPRYFPSDIADPVYVQDRARTFFNVKSWLEFLSQRDFSFGSRIHGNIAAVLAGIPAFVFVSDQRIRELVKYHNIPHAMISEAGPNTSIFDVYEKTDFGQIRVGHEERFFHYLDFLKKNDLETVYDEKGNAKEKPFDKRMEEIDFLPGMRAFSAVSVEEQSERLTKVFKIKRKQAAARKMAGDEKKSEMMEILPKIF